MPLLISDANILMDLDCGGVLDRIFRLEHKFAVLDVLFEEELSTDYGNLRALGLQILPLSDAGVKDGQKLIRDHGKRGASRNDLLALALARQEACPLLTGDRRLREVCQELGHSVRGTLSIMQELYESALLSCEEAATAYAAMKVQGRRLPWPDVQAQLDRMVPR
jgi:predicted nucleic acid-binding protein